MNLRLFILFFFISAFNISIKAQTVTDPWATLGASSIQTSAIAMDAANNLYVTNFGNHTISKITPNGTVTQAWATLAGGSYPYGIVIDASGNLYTVNRGPKTISKITPISDGSSGTVIQTWANLGGLEAYTLAIDASGNLYAPYVTNNRIDKIVPSQSGTSGVVTQNWVALASGANPYSISFDAAGNLYSTNSNSTISKISPDGNTVIQAWATLAGSSNPMFMVFDPTGNMYVSCWGTSTVSKINSSGTVTDVWSLGTSVWPAGIVRDAAGNIFTANFNNNTISKITSDGTVTQSYVSLANGAAPYYLAKDASGNLYVTNMGNGTVSKVAGPPSVTITSSASGAVCAGTNVTFTAVASNISSPTYQWTKNGIGIPGANASTYTSTTLSNNDVIKVWVNAGINNRAIVSNGLLLNLDASNPGSYAGTGSNWYDLSGNNNHATLMNSPTYDAASGSIVTNGTNQYISIPQFSTANTNITMQAWVYVNLNTTGTFMKNGTGGGGYSIGIGDWAYDRVGSNVVMLLYGRGWIGSGVSYATAGWKLVTLTLDGSSTARAYVDRSLIGTYTWTNPTSPAGSFNIGANIGDGNIYYNGKFAAAYFYNRALSLAEIQQNYDAFATKSTAYSSNTITLTGPSAPVITVTGDGCVNKTTLTTPTGLTSYAWYKDNIVINGATSNTYTPTAIGAYQVQVTSGSCSSTSTATTIYACAVSSSGQISATSNANAIISPEGGANFGTGRDAYGKLYNTTGLTTTSGTIGLTTAVLGGVISATNAITSSIGVVYSTDVNFGTSSSTTIQSNVTAGNYTSSITGLSSFTTYYAKSFIVNKAGTSYGNVISFTPGVPGIVTTGLIFNVDAANTSSYTPNGNVWTDLSGSNNINFYSNSSYNTTANPTFSSDGGGSLATTGVFGKSIRNSGITGAVARSFEAWVKFNSVSQNAVISIGNLPNDGLFELMAFQNNLINHIWGTFTKSTTVLTANTWYHLVITYDGATNHAVYVNGIKVGTSSSTDANNRTLNTINTPIYIGPAATTTWGAFDGKIGALRIYDHEMTSSEVTNNFDALKSRFSL